MYPTIESKILQDTDAPRITYGLSGLSDERIRKFAEGDYSETKKRNKSIEKQITDAYNHYVSVNQADATYPMYYKERGKEGVLQDYARVAPDLFPDLAKKYPPSTAVTTVAASTGFKKYLTRSNVIIGVTAIAAIYFGSKFLGSKDN